MDMESRKQMQLVASRKRMDNAKESSEFGGVAGWLLGLMRGWREEHKSSRQMCLVETLPLGGKSQLMLVTCAGESFLVGGGANGVETIVRVKSGGSQAFTTKSLEETCL